MTLETLAEQLFYASQKMDGGDEILRILRALPSPAVRVKGLVWAGSDRHRYSLGRLQHYTATEFYPSWQACRGGEVLSTHPTLEAAKAACEADNEARVLALLEPVAQPESEDSRRLDWLLAHIEQHGTRGISNLVWTWALDEEGEKTDDCVFDRAAIDRARSATADELRFVMAEMAASDPDDKPAQGVSREVLEYLVEGTREMIDSFGHFLDHYRGQPIPDVFKAWDEARRCCDLAAARAELERNSEEGAK